MIVQNCWCWLIAPMSGLRFEIIVVKARKLDGLEEGCLMLHCLPIRLVWSSRVFQPVWLHPCLLEVGDTKEPGRKRRRLCM
ncbi:hypothetical protein SORBI_3010G202200 [Sorghum bicolor]|uniref:Uncharacterized protein n=1 Tax=Sorghum bicolor TaxID=4558 RepID=A0A194YKD5_SORBI|nr:hypothetical protein SORBI_3010G202200 [Sorghum bicolor]